MRQSRCARPPDRHAHPDRIGCGSSPWQMKQTPPAAGAPWSAPHLSAAAAKLASVGAVVGEGVGVARAAAAILAGVGADVGEAVGAGVRSGLGTRVSAGFGVACRNRRRDRPGVKGVEGASSTEQSSHGLSQSGAAIFGVACRNRRRDGVGVEGVDGASSTGHFVYPSFTCFCGIPISASKQTVICQITHSIFKSHAGA
jgi:hypothetical protein